MSMKPGATASPAASISGAVRRRHGADGDDAAVCDRDVGRGRLGAGAVVDRAVPDHEVELTRGSRRSSTRARGPRRSARARRSPGWRRARGVPMIAAATSSPIAGAELEAVAAAAGREVQPVDAVDRAEQRVPVGRHVVEADAAVDGPQAAPSRGSRADDAFAHVRLERRVDRRRRRRPDRTVS